ncbi:Crinkler (CRN) family protein [Thraustotheca clavata]|uniref:Crinkler (CRN) family protein n=1 Tax=Thraustotheca clavata TaxID=74557 RepID=A0A1V9ZZV2_9STRA|nr:Crinkler (CRN) family protein [Thraustotheca clavata]
MEKYLVCIEIPGGSVFGVTIEPNQQVWELKNMIKEKKMYDFPADKLELYIAKKNHEWLKSKDADVKELKKGVVSDDINALIHDSLEMDPTGTIQMLDFPDTPAPGDIHVLVVVPPSMPTTGKRSNEDLGEIVEARLTKFFKDRDEKKVYSLSDLDSWKKQQIFNKMGLGLKVLELKEPRDTSIPGYQWIVGLPEGQEEQRTQYMTYLETHLMTLLGKKSFSLVDIANDKSVLDTVDARLPFRLNGTANVLLVKSKAIKLIPMAGICIVIELKKTVEKKHTHQAIGQLVCASIKAPFGCYPMSLLTDLNDTWLFSYFSDKKVLTQVLFEYPKNAIDFIKATIVNEPEHAVCPLSYYPVPFKKLRVDDFLPQIVDKHAAELMENYELMADE